MQKIVSAFHDMQIPNFSEFLRKPNDPLCLRIDSSRLMVEIITNLGNFSESTFSTKMLLGGEYSLVMRYKREKNNILYPTCAISMNFEDEKVKITQLQGSNAKQVGYRFASSFDSVGYFALLLEEAFIKNGIIVEVEKCPEGIEGASYASNAISKYQELAALLGAAKNKYQ